MRLFETNDIEDMDSPKPRSNESKMPHCKIYNPMTELTQPFESSRKGMYLRYAPVAIGLRKHEGRGH